MKKMTPIIFCIVLFFFAACRHDEIKIEEKADPEIETEEEVEDEETAIEITSDFYFDGIIDGKRVVMQDSIDHFLIVAGSGCTEVYECGCCIANQYSGLSTADAMTESEGVVKLEFIHLRFNKTFDYEADGTAAIDEIYRLGNYPYFDSNGKPDGAAIRYLDPEGQLWGSDAGPNPDIFLEVIEVLDEVSEHDNPYFQLHKVIEVHFSCTLYPFNNNLTLPKPKDKITLENGVMRIRASLH